MTLEDVRCDTFKNGMICNRLLGRIEKNTGFEIKCPKCKQIKSRNYTKKEINDL